MPPVLNRLLQCDQRFLATTRGMLLCTLSDVALQIGLARRRILAFWSAVLLSMVDALMLLALRIDLLTMQTPALLLRLAQLVVARTHCRFIIFARIRLGRTPRRSTRCLNLNRRAECVGALDAHTKRRTRSHNNNNT